MRNKDRRQTPESSPPLALGTGSRPDISCNEADNRQRMEQVFAGCDDIDVNALAASLGKRGSKRAEAAE